jgi:hypothetical protein
VTSLALAAECRPFVKWYAELYAENASFISVSVDARDIAANQYINNVSFSASFYDDRNQRIAEQSFDFPDEQLQGLSPGFYVAYLAHPHAAAKSARGGEMRFLCNTQGITFVKPLDKVPPNAELLQSGPAAATVIGEVPRKGEVAAGAGASARAASDFAGFWGNEDPNLHFVQFLRVVATGPTELQVDAWLRCAVPAGAGRLQDCQRWGPDRATITATGEVSWNHVAEPKVGRHIVTLEGDRLKLFTIGQGWTNYFRRVPR